MTVSRRQFCAALGAAGLSAAALPAWGDDKGSQPLRVIAYNIYACKGWPDDRQLAKQAVRKGQIAKRLAMELALYEPDIINFSESTSRSLPASRSRRKWPGTWE